LEPLWGSVIGIWDFGVIRAGAGAPGVRDAGRD